MDANSPRGLAGQFRRRLVLNTLVNAAGNGWSMVVALVSLPLVLHGLGATAFGLWVLVQTMSARRGWLSVVDLGIGTSAIRRIAALDGDDRWEGGAVAAMTALAIFAVLGVLAGVLLATLGPWLLIPLFRPPPELEHAVGVAIVLFAIQVPFDLVGDGAGDCLSGLQRLDIARGLDALRRTSIAVATSSAALTGGGIDGVARASLLCTALTAALSTMVVVQRGVRSRPRWREARRLIAGGVVLGIFGAFGIVEATMDRIIVGVIAGPAAVTIVEIAAQLQAGVDGVLAASTVAALPGASWVAARGGGAELKELFVRGTRYSLLVVYPVAILGMVLAVPIISVWVGSGYDGARWPVVLALAYMLLGAPAQVGSFILVASGRIRVLVPSYAFATMLNAGATVVLVMRFGPAGAFLASLASTPVYLVPMMRHEFHVIGVSLRIFTRDVLAPVVAPSVLAACITSVTLALLPLPPWGQLVIGGTLGALTFGIAAWRWSLSPHELRELLALLRRPSDGQP